jgi:type I restriction enzyme S subunit
LSELTTRKIFHFKREFYQIVHSLLFPTPPQGEQREIVEYISDQNLKINNGIAIKEKQITALKEYKTNLINAAVTGKIKVV